MSSIILNSLKYSKTICLPKCHQNVNNKSPKGRSKVTEWSPEKSPTQKVTPKKQPESRIVCFFVRLSNDCGGSGLGVLHRISLWWCVPGGCDFVRFQKMFDVFFLGVGGQVRVCSLASLLWVDPCWLWYCFIFFECFDDWEGQGRVWYLASLWCVCVPLVAVILLVFSCVEYLGGKGRVCPLPLSGGGPLVAVIFFVIW